jgi:lysophospholipase L1-like esterase
VGRTPCAWSAADALVGLSVWSNSYTPSHFVRYAVSVEWYESEVQSLERASQARVNGNRPPVFYGSSSIRLWDTLAEDFDPRVLNLGFGGSTLQACDYFFTRLVPPVRPRSLLLYAGDNDLADGRSVEEVLAWFRSLANKVAALGPVPFGFVSVKPSPARFPILDRIRLLNDQIRRDIESRPSGYYVDVFPAMLDPSGKPRPEFFLEDGLHLSRKGYRLWSRLLEPHRNQIFTR